MNNKIFIVFVHNNFSDINSNFLFLVYSTIIIGVIVMILMTSNMISLI